MDFNTLILEKDDYLATLYVSIESDMFGLCCATIDKIERESFSDANFILRF